MWGECGRFYRLYVDLNGFRYFWVRLLVLLSAFERQRDVIFNEEGIDPRGSRASRVGGCCCPYQGHVSSGARAENNEDFSVEAREDAVSGMQTP